MEDVTKHETGLESKPTDDTTETGYMLIDHEEVLIRQLSNIRHELSTQIADVRRELETQWDVLSRLLLFIAPVAITWAVSMFVRLAGNRTWESSQDTPQSSHTNSVKSPSLHRTLQSSHTNSVKSPSLHRTLQSSYTNSVKSPSLRRTLQSSHTNSVKSPSLHRTHHSLLTQTL
ncbi:uncharacterized protein LOC110446014 [Mizuhopecten yessoensis]|uniref:uncharacterized protein LOC110446014 n=1 Tax=Mizuhopecten yessoensis TaxID=6573 RepID=UPI000B45D928|nr:uncharacterized protein LOC110446014 [Mizuhopecten yessoensis]